MNGLSEKEVIHRRTLHGKNKLKEPEKKSSLLRFLSQYHDPLNYLLITAAIVALLIHPDQPGDAIFIFIVLTANATLDFGRKDKLNKQWMLSNRCQFRLVS